MLVLTTRERRRYGYIGAPEKTPRL